MHTTRDSWLRAATEELRPYFVKLGHPLSDKIRASIGFPSSGKRTKVVGECFHPAASEDQHYEIFIRVDQADPVDVLGVLVHELVSILRERLNAIIKTIGPLPHAKLNFSTGSDVPKKQTARMLKAECGKACGYTIRLAAKWAREGLPVCPINAKHGSMICDIPDDDNEESQPDIPRKQKPQAITHSETAVEV